MKRYHLGEFEEIVLLTIAMLCEVAYGISVKEEIESRLAIPKVSPGLKIAVG